MSHNVLVTGGAGFIGSHAVDALLARGESVTVLDRKAKGDAPNLAHVMNEIEYIEGDVRDAALTERLAGKHSHILHFAAIVSIPESIKNPYEVHDVNVTGTFTVLESAKRAGATRVVYASSAAVYGDTEVVPTPEDVPPHPLSPYGLHKVMNEQHARLYTEAFGLPTVGLRFFNVFGSRQDPDSPYSGVISIFAHKIQVGESPVIFGDGTATRDFVHVSDIVNACVRTLFDESGAGEVFNVGTGTQTSVNDLVGTLKTATGATINPIYQAERQGDIRHSCASIDKIVDAFGYAVACNFEEGINETLKSA